MKPADVRELSEAELNDRIAQIQEELFRLRFRSATQQLEQPSLLRDLRRDVARLKTIQRQRELAQEKR